MHTFCIDAVTFVFCCVLLYFETNELNMYELQNWFIAKLADVDMDIEIHFIHTPIHLIGIHTSKPG